MKKQLLAVIMSLAMLALLAPTASAEYEGDGYIWLYDDGAEGSPSATTDWRFYVATPTYVALDDLDGYWNFTCYGQMVNATGSAATAEYNVTIYIEAGGLNKSATSSITVSKTAVVYGNLSYSDAVYSLFDANDTAKVYVVLDSDSADLDTWTGTISIEEKGAYAAMGAVLTSLVGVVIVIGVMSFLMNWMGDVQKDFGGQGGGGSRKKRSRGKKK